jgi:NADH-quinone oxidoreductase subunit C
VISSAPRFADLDESIWAPLLAEDGVRRRPGIEVAFDVPRGALLRVIDRLRVEFEYQQLMEIAGVDYPERPERFEVVYCLLSLTRNHRIRVHVTTDEAEPVPSVTGIWPVAGWLEREVYDLYGVLFDGNTDLRRILTDYGFQGHPLRKDFPMTGYVELRYSEEAKRVVYEPVNLAQDFRNFDFLSPWEGAAYALPGDEKATGPGPADTPQAKAGPSPAAVAPKVPEQKGAPTPLAAEEIIEAGAKATKQVQPRAKTAKTVDGTGETGAGEASPGNEPESKPTDPDVMPSKGKGQNQ